MLTTLPVVEVVVTAPFVLVLAALTVGAVAVVSWVERSAR